MPSKRPVSCFRAQAYIYIPTRGKSNAGAFYAVKNRRSTYVNTQA